jgi:hypothetical protein
MVVRTRLIVTLYVRTHIMDPGNSKIAGRLELIFHLISLFASADIRGVMSALLTHIGVTGMSIPKCRSRCPRHLRRGSVAACMLGLGGVRILPGARMFANGRRCVLSGTGLCNGMITRPEDSYRVWSRNLNSEETYADESCRAARKKIPQDNPREITWWTVATVGGKPKCSHWQVA